MKLLVLTTTFPRWRNDTVPAFVYELSRQLHESGLEIVVLMPHCEGALEFEILDGVKIYRFKYFYPSNLQKLVNGNGILPNLKASHLAKFQIPFLFFFELLNTFRIIKKEKIDCIQSHWIVPNGLIGAIISRFFKINHVLTEHGAGLIALKKLPFNTMIFTFILNNTKEITVVSEKIADDLLCAIKKTDGSNIPYITTIPMGISPEKFRTSGEQVSGNSAAEQITLLFIGRIAEKKGLDYLLDAIPAVIREYANIQVFVCGDGPDKAVCEKKCGFLKIGNYVKFKGRISEQEKIDYLRRTDILVIPSIVTVDGDTEGVPVVLLEGLAAGKTIIASRVGGIPDVIKDGYNGILIPEKNSEQISKNILKLISEPGLRKKLSQNAFQSSRLFEWKCIGDQYLHVLKR